MSSAQPLRTLKPGVRLLGVLGALVFLCAADVFGQAAAQTPPTPTAPPTAPTAPTDFELNTVLMQTTFMIQGQNAQGQPLIGTIFVMGRPFPGQPTRGAYVLITAAHVLSDMQGDSAVIFL